MHRKGFTLIELLVVIGIIAVLSILAVPNFMSARAKARDVQRKSDLKQIQNALELYKQDQTPPRYPDPSDITFPPAAGQPFKSADGTVTYMQRFPIDPNTNSAYTYTLTSVVSYTMSACLENKADSQGVSCGSSPTGQGPGGGTGGSCASGVCYSVTEP